ncbi:MAG: OmpH family outer membrane protein [Deltaproteobacteria bacterium]|nr:MAG: OmpH family outer membrane protein [Deltaproteobacteria bacterium]
MPMSHPLHPIARRGARCTMAALTLLALVAPAHAAPEATRVAVVDVRQVVLALPEAKTVEARLGELTRERAHALERQKRELIAAEEAIAASDAPEAERARQLADLEARRQQLKASAHALSGELAKEERRLLEPVYGRIEKAIAALAAEDGLALVLRKPLAGVAYQAPGVALPDLTSRVIARLGQEGGK